MGQQTDKQPSRAVITGAAQIVEHGGAYRRDDLVVYHVDTPDGALYRVEVQNFPGGEAVWCSCRAETTCKHMLAAQYVEHGSGA